MAKRTLLLLSLMGLCGPAFGQVASVDGLGSGGVPAGIPPWEEAADLGADDCEERYRTLRARSQMRPSDRKAALAFCRAAASAQEWQEKLAQRLDDSRAKQPE